MKIVMSLYAKLNDRTPQGFFLLADTAFPRSGKMESHIKTPLKAGVRLPADPQEHFRVLEES